MDFIKSEIKNIIIFVVILVGLYLSYIYFFPSATPTTVDYPAGAGGDVGGEVLAILSEVGKIGLNQEIFNDPLFESLKSFSKELVFEGDPGRSNPFAPFEQGVLASPKINVGTTIQR